MKKILRRFVLIVLLTLIWCILNEKFNIATIISGIFVSFVASHIQRTIQPEKTYKFSYHISLVTLLAFFGVLFKNIYFSAFIAIRHIVKDEINPQFVATNTKIKRPWLQALIGNAITLTPGTVTVHMNDGHYTVLWLFPKTVRHKDIKRHLIQDFEDCLIKEDKHA